MAEMENQKFDYEAEIWSIANFVWGPIKTSEFNRVILPFTMLRRLECALEPTRDAVSQALADHEAEWGRESDNYCNFSKKAFYNVTRFRLNSLGSTDTLEALMAYIDGFSPNAREIMKRFKMEETCKTLDEHGMLYAVCQRFASFDLSPEAVSDREMSNIYEHLIQKFGESIAENAEDFMTPKDVVRLAVGMIFANDDELMNSDTGIVRTLYDPTMGTGGFISDALDQLDEWHKDKKMTAPAVIVPYGQEVEPESWAMGKAAMLLRNVSNADSDVYDQIKDMSSHIEYGNTLTDDKFPYDRFDYQLSNPPYGKSWTPEQPDVLDEAKLGFSGRFGAGLPSVDDGSMLFLQHVASKIKPASEGGGKAGIVLSASPLFTGDAGSGPSNIRRWLFKEDLVDCIVKLPVSIFFRTGINTFLWILSTKKPDGRKGMVQLIDASDRSTLLRKNQGNKRYEISEDDRNWIIDTYVNGHDHGNSVLVPAETFMYRKVTTQRPLRAVIKLSEANICAALDSKPLTKLSEANRLLLGEYLSELSCMNSDETVPYEIVDTEAKNARKELDKPEVTAAVIAKAIRDNCVLKGPDYPVIYDRVGNIMPDPDLKDAENIPYGTSFEDYMATEVLPYAPETWIDETVRDKGPLQDGGVGVVGTNISFNKFFYHYEEPRKPEEIAAEIMELESGLEEFMKEFLV